MGTNRSFLRLRQVTILALGALGCFAGSLAEDLPASPLVGQCEVCVYVIENKEQHQPYLCRGLKDPNYQKTCVQVLESLMWWLTNEVYWLNYGCQRDIDGDVEWVRPCPAHAVCSWIEQLYTRTPYCPADPYFAMPEGFPAGNVVPVKPEAAE